MIRFFRKYNSDSSGKKVEQWLKERNIAYKPLCPYTIKNTDLLQMLSVSEEGFDSLIISKSKSEKSWKNAGLQTSTYQDLPVGKMIDILLKNPQLFRTPILFDEHRLLVGFNEEEIRMFIPRDYRQVDQK